MTGHIFLVFSWNTLTCAMGEGHPPISRQDDHAPWQYHVPSGNFTQLWQNSRFFLGKMIYNRFYLGRSIYIWSIFHGKLWTLCRIAWPRVTTSATTAGGRPRQEMRAAKPRYPIIAGRPSCLWIWASKFLWVSHRFSNGVSRVFNSVPWVLDSVFDSQLPSSWPWPWWEWCLAPRNTAPSS